MDITVEEFTTPSVVTIESEAGLGDALDLMKQMKIRHLPVTREGKICGIISERDLLSHHNKPWAKMMSTRDIMSENILTVYKHDNLGQVAYQLANRKVGSALVVDANDKLYGIFTTTDALNALVEIVYPDAHEKSEIKDIC
jgi:acetoin utilization protein AcuB